MERAILFRFHDRFDICRGRVALLRRLNPDIPIIGLYGGDSGGGEALADLIQIHSPDVSALPSRENEPGAWKHGDLVVRTWFLESGHRIRFDMLHVVEWDLLILEPVDKVFGHIGGDEVGLTGLVPASRKPNDWPWLASGSPPGSEWLALCAHVGNVGEPHVCQGPGMCLPRVFLERYAATDVPTLCNDEVRIPLYAQAFGFALRNTGIAEAWSTPFFNCQKRPIRRGVVMKELAKPNGYRVFHPFLESFGMP